MTRLQAFGLSLCWLAAGNLVLAQEHTPQNEKNPFAGNAAAATSGQRLYQQTCQACHGGNAAGGDRGPALATGVFKHGSKDGEIFLNIRNGVSGTQMPPFGGLTVEQVWQVVTYLRSLSGSTMRTAETVAGDPRAGETLFFGKAACASCHEINGRGGILGPDLSAAAAAPAQTLRQKIENPNAPSTARGRGRGPRGGHVIVRTKEGREIQGVRRSEDTFTLQVTDISGKLHIFNKETLAERRDEAASLMPADYAKRLTASEIQNVVAYLKTLETRDLQKAAQVEIPGGLSYERIRNAAAEPQNWLTYWGNYQGHHFSALSQINTGNVKQLQARWAMQMPGDSLLESTPLVVDGIMYTAGMPGQVFALDAHTGMQIWKYQRKQKVVNPFESNRYNRGVAMLDNRVVFGTLDAALVALDARTGRPLWETQVADTMEGYSITVAPLAIKDKIIVGVAGGEHGIRGFLDAYDSKTGKRLWRFHTVPGPGEFGHETWQGDSWKRGGAPTWLTGSYDPELNLIYWATGNPGPDMDAEVRKGDNLFSCSVVALDATTGQRKWHYQFTPADSHDWDANEDLVLVDRVVDGKMRKLLMQPNRNGLFYVLDRTNGQLLMGKPFVRQTWNAGFEADGRPKVIPDSDSSLEGRVVFPGLGGGTNWQSPSFDAATGLMYVVYSDGSQKFVREPSVYEPGKAYWGGRSLPAGDPPIVGIKAIDTVTGQTRWDYKISRGSLAAGVLATAGGVLFSATAEGNLLALEAKTGRLLWQMQTGATIASSPISYSVNGKQFIAISAGEVLYSFSLPE